MQCPLEDHNAAGRCLVGGLEDHTANGCDTDPTGGKDSGDCRVVVQCKRAVRGIHLQRCAVGQAFEDPLKCCVTHARGNARVLFVGSARQRKPACVPFRIGLGLVDERQVGELTCLLLKAFWRFKVKRHRAVCHVLSPRKPHRSRSRKLQTFRSGRNAALLPWYTVCGLRHSRQEQRDSSPIGHCTRNAPGPVGLGQDG
jgi:hypothetical protein